MTDEERLTRLEHEVQAAQSRVKQHEDALAYAREMMADYQRGHEAAERNWLAQFRQQAHELEQYKQQIARLKDQIVSLIVQRSKVQVH